ncbi:E3 SUMO-protein ligase RanBP2 [Agrilus planipennis]|uniref:Nuclear pore complex protein Nup153 n=1 Tax=Agrilus planipennis TaxID=224129 RepID=A0A1W4X5S2_AGRPL|nr:E3 SUMO-protein ligase RanBP2 [Agrilus planipennis]
MFTTKLEVDKHVENNIKKINNERERNLRGYAFAKLYYKVGDYESARRFVSAYLHVKPSAEAYNLLGKTLEKQEKYDSALEAYRRSFELDSKQNNLLIKICELLALENTNFDLTGARYYCEKAQKIDPKNPVLYSLKEKIIKLESDNPNDITQLYLNELEMQPNNINSRIKLLRHLLEYDKIDEAYKHVYELEQQNLPVFANSLSWYEVSTEVLLRYQSNNLVNSNLTWEFWLLLLTILDKFSALSLDEYFTSTKSSTDYVTCVYNFDQTLFLAEEKLIKDCPERPLIQEFINHYKGQLALYLTTLLFKQAKKDLISYKEASQITLPLLFVAFHTEPPDLESIWLSHADDKYKRLMKRWHVEASYRCSQAGHILTSAAKNKKHLVIEKTQQLCSGLWRPQIFKKIFVTRDQQAKIKSSFFVNSSSLTDFPITLSNKNNILKFDQVGQLLYPNSLHHLIWIGLNTILPSFDCSVFDGLPYSVKHLENSSAESLSLLDIQAFFYCAVFCAEAQIEESKRNILLHKDKPEVLPASITNALGTVNQHKWFTIAYQMYKKELSHNLVEIRTTLIRGLEVVRCIGNHGLSANLLIKLARVFVERAKNCTKHSEIEANNAHAELYWKTAITILEKLRNKRAVTYTKDTLFDCKSRAMTYDEIVSTIDEGKLFLATRLISLKDYEKALNILENIKDPYASFYQGQIYFKMAEEQIGQNRQNLTSEMRNQYIILLTRTRDSYYLTLDRLRDPSADHKHPLNAQLGDEIEKVEKLISKFDTDINGFKNDGESLLEDNFSFFASTGDNPNIHTIHTLPNSSFNGHVTPKRDSSRSVYLTPKLEGSFRHEARPSPERLDAQLRQLQTVRDSAFTQILEQNRVMVESLKDVIKTTVEELKSVKTSVEELKDIKKSLNELKNSVDDLQNFRDVTDMVQEMKKEIAELKSGSNKPKHNQLNDEDLYVLDEEFGGDYNINANLGNLNQGLYSNYQNRVQPANALPYALYAGMYPPLYPFPGLGLPQAGALPFGQDAQVPDFRGLTQTLGQTLYGQQSLGQTSLNQTLPGQPLNAQTLTHPLSSHTLGQLGQTLNAQTIGQIGQTLNTHGTSQLSQALSSQTLSQQSPFAHLNLGQQTLGQSTNLTQSTGLAGAPLLQSNLFKDKLDTGLAITSMPTTSLQSSYTPSSVASSKAPPINVVITSSDPLPKTTAQAPQILSVTIPPQHLKGNLPPKSQPHGYQIPVTTSALQTMFSAPSVLHSVISSTSSQSLSSAAIASDKITTQTSSNKQVLEKSNLSNASVGSAEEHDPCPDFKPIIDLPDEVPLNTGEENEEELFCHRAKLFRYDNKEWKERGIGKLKILKNKTTGKIRVLMRREQVLKICANHFITKDMILTPMPKSDRAYMWVANDFADEKVVLEKLCVRFKTAEEAEKFAETFEKAKKDINNAFADKLEITNKIETTTKSSISTPQPQSAGFGGFVFTSTPTFKLKENVTVTPIPTTQHESPKTSPFASFSFTKPTTSETVAVPLSFVSSPLTAATENPQNKSDKSAVDDSQPDDDFKPTVEFKPVVPLPDLVEIKTGEEGSEILFQSRAKLLRFDPETKEWKERGIGDIKILKDKTIRLVMRREQVHKVCCNHQLFKTTDFTKMGAKAFSWCAQDFSEGVLKPEMFAIRFKSEEQADNFFKAVQSAQQLLNNKNVVEENKETENTSTSRDDKKIKSTPPEPSPKPSEPAKQGWGDKFKPKSGSWECKNCYIINDIKDTHCVACETAKSGTTPKKSDSGESGPQFSFGLSSANGGFSFGQKAPPAAAISSPSLFGPQITSSPATSTSTTVQATSGWGDAFKPKEGSWNCTDCLIRNDPDKLYCVACEAPKDNSVPRKEVSKGVNLDTPGVKFTFGCSPSIATVTSTTASNIFSAVTTSTPGSTFTFGVPSSTSVTNTFGLNSFSFGIANDLKPVTETSISTPNSTSFNFTLTKPAKATTKEHEESKENFVFGSPQKYTFEFTPRSPRRQSSGPGEEESDGYVEDEGDQIYFKPVIPLPDKIEVKTGEEEEDVLYCHRAKLFRFVDGEWKERGVGDLKILYQQKNGKLRVLMRRDQVLKICLNHWLTPAVEYLPKDDKTWLFSAPDFSEGEINQWQFCLRFKNAEVANEFKKAVADALDKIKGDPKAKSVSDFNVKEKVVVEEPNSSLVLSKDSDVEFVSETIVTPEEEKEALRLGLPPKFMSYRQLPDCTCDICKREDELLGSPFQTDLVKSTTSAAEIKSKTKEILTAPKFVFGTPTAATTTVSTTFSFGAASNTTSNLTKSSEPLKTILSKPSVLENVANKKEEALFEFSSAAKKETSPLSTFTFSLKPSTNFGSKQSDLKTEDANGSSFFFDTTPTNSFSTGNLFSLPSTTATSTIFGSPSALLAKPSDSNTVFGGSKTEKPFANVFGGGSNTSIFTTASSLNTSPEVSNHIFGSAAVSKSQEKTDSVTNLPESNKLLNTCGSEKSGSEPEFLKVDPGLSFASLAASSQSTEPKSTEKDKEQQPFTFLGAGAPVFSSLSKKDPERADPDKNKTDEEAESVGTGTNVDEEYDPHYEPVVPLPDQIVVTTGEEEETVKFSERAKLYRFDANTKEWKERGVGNIKILYHPEKGTYRLLLRREQVHKVVLNMLITPTLDLQPLSTSDKAWMWFGMNYTEDTNQLEKLAVRFKYIEQAALFSNAISDAIASIKVQQQVNNTVPSFVQNFGQSSAQKSVDDEEDEDAEDEDCDVEDEEEEDDDDDDDDDDDERSTMFKKRCTLSEELQSGEWKDAGTGELEIYYDSEIYGARINMTDDSGELICSTIIAQNTPVEQEGKECTWKAVEWSTAIPYRRHLKATFSNETAADEFHMTYLEGVQYAHATDICDDVYLEHLENNEN